VGVLCRDVIGSLRNKKTPMSKYTQEDYMAVDEEERDISLRNLALLPSLHYTHISVHDHWIFMKKFPVRCAVPEMYPRDNYGLVGSCLTFLKDHA
jgi:hypothetical protein